MKRTETYKKTLSFLTAAMTFALTAAGCSESPSNKNNNERSSVTSSTESKTEKTSSGIEAKNISELSLSADLFSSRDLTAGYSSITADIVLSGSKAEYSGTGVSYDGKVIAITEEGVYHITGTLDDGYILIDAHDAKVQLVLDNADITSSDHPAVYIADADKVFITLAEGSTNSLTDGSSYDLEEGQDEPDAAVFSEDSLTINGSGSLTVNGNYSDGIRCKDDIVITGGNITVNSKNDGIKAKDYVAAAGGNVTINAGQDGIKATNTEDASLGFVYIAGGSFDITASGDGIQAETIFRADGGDIDITAGGGSTASTKTHTEAFGGGGGMRGGFGGEDFDPENFDFGEEGEMPFGGGMQGGFSREDFGTEDFTFGEEGEMPFGGGMHGGYGRENFGTEVPGSAQSGEMPFGRKGGQNAEQPAVEQPSAEATGMIPLAAAASSDTEVSTKGIKAGTSLEICGGNITVDSADDALHSNADLTISGGELSLTAGDDGIHADSAVNVSDGSIDIVKSYEGIEAASINIKGGTVAMKTSDDGFNASDGTAQGGMGTYSDALLDISGGTVYVDAGGDGLDSNGDISVSGGTVIVNGPTNSGNGALDSNGSITVTGGLLIAAGMSGMAEYPGSGSTQNSVSATFTETFEGGTLITLTDESGKEIFSFAPSKTFNNIIISSPEIKTGSTYKIYTGGSSSAKADSFGYYAAGGYKNDGTEAGSFTAENVTSFIGTQSMMGGGFGGHGGGMRGGFGGEMTPPDGESGATVQPGGKSTQQQSAEETSII